MKKIGTLLLFFFLPLLTNAQTTYSEDATRYYLSNGTIKVGFDKRMGGVISYMARFSNGSYGTNLVNNHDAGRQVGFETRIDPDGSSPTWKPYNNSKYLADIFPGAGGASKQWNGLPQGSFYNTVNANHLGGLPENVIFNQNTGVLYIKAKLWEWGFVNETTPNSYEKIDAGAYNESWISLEGIAVKVSTKQTRNIPYSQSLNTSSLLLNIFININYDFASKWQTYRGNEPWTNQNIEQRTNFDLGPGNNNFWDLSTENWAAFTNNSDFGVGIYFDHKAFGFNQNPYVSFLYGERQSGSFCPQNKPNCTEDEDKYAFGSLSFSTYNYGCNGQCSGPNNSTSVDFSFLVGNVNEIRQYAYSKHNGCTENCDCSFTLTNNTQSGTTGSSLTLNPNCSGADCGGVSYSWTCSNGTSGNGLNVTLPSEGNYTYTVTGTKNDCPSKTSTITVPVTIGGCLTVTIPNGGYNCVNKILESINVSGGSGTYVYNIDECENNVAKNIMGYTGDEAKYVDYPFWWQQLTPGSHTINVRDKNNLSCRGSISLNITCANSSTPSTLCGTVTPGTCNPVTSISSGGTYKFKMASENQFVRPNSINDNKLEFSTTDNTNTFRLDTDGSGYKMTNISTGKIVEIQNGSTGAGGVAMLAASNPSSISDHQRFQFELVNGNFKIKPASVAAWNWGLQMETYSGSGEYGLIRQYGYDNPLGSHQIFNVCQISGSSRMASNELIQSESEEKQGIFIAPNPVNNILHYSFISDAETDEIELQIFDMTGRNITNVKKHKTGRVTKGEISVENFTEGSYILNATDGIKKDAKRFIKQ